MQPPSEHVHWLFATGFLLLGLCLLGEAIVGTEVWRRRAWRAYLWPGLAFALGVLLWPVMTFYTNSAIHMLAHGAWAQVMMLAGATELALVRGKLQSQWWRLGMAAGIRRLRRCVPRSRAERVAVPALLVPASPARVDAARGRDLPAGSLPAAAFAGRGDRVRADVRGHLRDALLRSRRRSDLRAHLGARGDTASMKRLLLIAATLRARVAGAGVRARVALADDAGIPRAAALVAAEDRAALRPVRAERCPTPCSSIRPAAASACKRVVIKDRTLTAWAPHLAKGAYTVRWHAMSGDGHVVSGVFTFGVRAQRTAPDGGIRSIGADKERGRRALAVLPRAGVARRRAGLQAAGAA